MTDLQQTSTQNPTDMDTYGKKKKLIYLHLLENSNKFNQIRVRDIADATGFNQSTIRYYLAQLVKEKKIFSDKCGLSTHYYTSKTFIQLIQHIKPKDDNPLPYMHGLVLSIENLSSTQLTLGVKCNCKNQDVFSLKFSKPRKNSRSGFCVCQKCGGKIRNNFPTHRKWRDRNITFTYGKVKKSCTVWVGSTFSPMSYYDFKDLINYLEGLVRIDIWENLDKWMIKQVGFNNDIKAEQLDRIDFDCTLNDLGFVFARMYEKDFQVDSEIEKGVRFEVHIETVQKLQNYFLPLIQGGMDMSAILNVNAALHMKLDKLVDALTVSNNRILRLEKEIYNLSKKQKR